MSSSLLFSKNKPVILIAGIANEQSIAYGAAKVLHEAGAELILTHFDSPSAKARVSEYAKRFDAKLCLPLNVTDERQVESAFKTIEAEYGVIDGFIHSIAFCTELHLPVHEVTKQGFNDTMGASCYSFIEMCRYAKGLMADGGSIVNYSYDSAHIHENYRMMGLAKAALETATRYIASEFGEYDIRVNCISPGTIATRAGMGIAGFEEMMVNSIEKAVDHKLPTTEEVGKATLYYMSDLSKGVTGTVHLVDHGVSMTD